MDDIKDRTRKIIDSSLIIDSLSHGPIVWTDSLVSICNDMVSIDTDPWKIIQDIILLFAKNIVSNDDYFTKYVDAWRKSGVTCISWTLGPIHERPYSFDGILHNYSFLTYLMDNRRDFFIKVLKAEDIKRAYAEKKKGIIFNLQNVEPIGSNLEMLELFYMMGLKIMQLTLNTKNLIGTGCMARRDRGLTEFGADVIQKMNELGIIVDISHCGPKTTMDAVENSNDPIMATHTFSKKVYNHVRGKDDELLKAIAEKGGYIGILTIPDFLTNKPNPSIEDWLDHLDYVVNIAGIDHVGIGTDFYGQSLPDTLASKIDEFLSKLGMGPEHGGSFKIKMKGFEDYIKFPNLIEGLITRGYNDQEIKKIAGENFFLLFKKVVG